MRPPADEAALEQHRHPTLGPCAAHSASPSAQRPAPSVPAFPSLEWPLLPPLVGSSLARRHQPPLQHAWAAQQQGWWWWRRTSAEPRKKVAPSLDLLSPISSSRSEFYPGNAGAKHPSLRHDLQPSGKKLVFSFQPQGTAGTHTERAEAQPARQRSRRGGGAGTVWPAQVGLGAGGRSSGAPSCPSHRHKVAAAGSSRAHSRGRNAGAAAS